MKGKPLLLQIGVVIGWEQSSYTVGEGDGQLQVCVTLTGYLEAVLQQLSIRAVEGTAIRGKGKNLTSILTTNTFSLNYFRFQFS